MHLPAIFTGHSLLRIFKNYLPNRFWLRMRDDSVLQGVDSDMTADFFVTGLISV